MTGHGVVKTSELGPKIVMSKDGITLDGVRLVAIDNGVLDRSRLDVLMRELERKSTDAPLAVTLDATLPYYQVGVLFAALKQGGFRNLALLTGTGTTMIPIELPDTEEANGKGLRPVVTVKKNFVMVWSASGLEGTRAKPKLAYELKDPPDFAPVTRALADIVQTRWPIANREDADKTIILQLDSDKTVQVMLQLAAAVRSDGSRELFPGIYLAGG